MQIENAKNLGDVLDYCIQNGIKKRNFIHKTCAMTCDFPIREDLSEGIRKAVENGPRYKKARNGSVWKIEQYNFEGSGRDSGYASYGFSVEEITIE